MDRFSFIALDLSLQGVIADKSLYPKFREGGETIIFRANDFADPSNSEIFRLLMTKPKLKNHAQNLAAICGAPLSAVPSLEDFLAGRNIPAAKAAPIKISTTTKIAPQPVGYISAHPVVDALNFDAALGRVGDRVELVGRIIEVKPGTGRRGRGRGKPYVFINFGPWRGNIVKISVWSEGLARLKEQPSAAWVNRWVSVVGLMDPPYDSNKYGYRHLSVTVEQDGQIQFLDEAQARFRLASVGKVVGPRNRDFVKTIIDGLGSPKQPVSGPSTPRNPVGQSPNSPGAGTRSRNTAIVEKIKRESQIQSGNQTTTPASPRASTPTASKGLLGRIPGWVWVVGAIVLLWLISVKR